jgi:hypothetical protein
MDKDLNGFKKISICDCKISSSCSNCIKITKFAHISCKEELKRTFLELNTEREMTENYFAKSDKITREEKNDCLIIRMHLVDWIFQVCKKLKVGSDSFNLAVDLLDKMIVMYKFKLKDDQMLLLAIGSLVIAMKYFEIKHVSMDFIVKKVAHKKFTKEDIIGAEFLILNKLKFMITGNKFDDFLNLFFCFSINSDNGSQNRGLKNPEAVTEEKNKFILCGYYYKLQQMALMIYKLVCLDIETIRLKHFKNNKLVLYASILDYCAKIMSKNSNLSDCVSSIESNIEKLNKSLNISEKDVTKVNSRITTNIKSLQADEHNWYLREELKVHSII